MIDESFDNDHLSGGRSLINRYNLMVFITYAYAFRKFSLRDMESFCKFDLRVIYIMNNEIPSHTTIGKFYNEFNC
ncbi:transposase [Thomasclavelia sp.]